MNRPLGCLTGGGLLTAGLTLALLLVIYLAAGGAMFSPGPLNAQAGDEALGSPGVAAVRSHAETAGQCAACHIAPWSSETMPDRCLSCHSSVANEVAANQGLHAEFRGQAAAFDCRPCHTEHRGATAALTEINPDDFPHAASGYDLAGHQMMADGRPFACGDCHVKSISEFVDATCADCHRQLDASYTNAHVADFGEACLGCHDGVDRYSRDRFDHNALPFRLEGGHAEIACRECHIDTTTIAQLQNTNTGCIDCHRQDDAHRSQFGTDCAACHNTSSWPDATFDHAQTAFPLIGKHVDVACEDCHQNGIFQGAPSDCVACHVDPDFHRGALGTQCEDCHTATGWQPATFIQQHTFPIDHGESGPSTCRTCHPDSVSAYTCYGCHEHTPADTIAEHEGEVSGDIADCARCHPTGQKDEAERERDSD